MRFVLLILLLALAGCDGPPEAKADPVSARDERMRRAKEALAQPPKVTKRTMDGGELILMEVPVDLGHGLVDTQRCFIWRDEAYRTASMQCPAELPAP